METVFEAARTPAMRREFLSVPGHHRLSPYIMSDECVMDLRRLEAGKRELAPPDRLILRKTKREVYRYSEKDSCLLKLLVFAAHRYDAVFSGSSFAWKLGMGRARMIAALRKSPNLAACRILKGDIAAYTASMDAGYLKDRIRLVFAEDPVWRDFLLNAVDDRRYFENGEIHLDAPAVKTGSPLTYLFGALYLTDFDRCMEKAADVYVRYNDEFILGVSDPARFEQCIQSAKTGLSLIGLRLNPGKSRSCEPGERYEIFSYEISGGRVALSEKYIRTVRNQVRLIKQGVLHMKQLHGFSDSASARLMIRQLAEVRREITGTFPALSSADSLRRIDTIFKEAIRSAGSGTSSKARYRIRLKDMQLLGYESLVHEYYRNRRSFCSAQSGAGMPQTAKPVIHASQSSETSVS